MPNERSGIDQNMRKLEDMRPENIDEFYRVAVCEELPKEERELRDVNRIVADIHEDLRNYGSLEGEKKAAVVSAILLAIEEATFDVSDLKSHDTDGAKDGDKIYNAVDIYLRNADLGRPAKVGELLDQFMFLKSDITLNTKREKLGMSPLKHFAEKLERELSGAIKRTDFDILGNFYGGSDENPLGIVITPRHVTHLMAELIDINKSDMVLDPTCGSGAFLVSAMNRMIDQCDTPEEELDVKRNRLHGIELQQKLFAIATTNMILRGDGKSNLRRDDLFNVDTEEMQKLNISKVLINPPYSQAKTKDLHHLAEISFISRTLDLMAVGGKMAAIVPQSTMVGKTKQDKLKKKAILKNNTLESVITLNKDTFYGVGTNPCIVIFEAGKPHPKNKRVNFVDFSDDGHVVRKHIGLVGDGTENSKKEFLLEVLADNVDADTSFVVKSAITWEDEWLHSFYYFNDTPPSVEDFKKTMADYMSFEFDMRVHGRGYLFDGSDDSDGVDVDVSEIAGESHE